MHAAPLAALAALSIAALACSPLPEAAAPKGSLVDEASLKDADLIGYRTLTRADFKGKKAPPEFAAVADSVGAATCGHVITSPNAELRISGKQSPGGTAVYWSVVKNLSFRALMDRNCSWWNESLAKLRPAYVLEHEQIHFAIFELGARKLNASAADIAKEMQAEGSSEKEVHEHVTKVHADAMQGALEAIIERSRDFDEDTSLGYKPERQKQWLSQVTSELASTTAWAR